MERSLSYTGKLWSNRIKQNSNVGPGAIIQNKLGPGAKILNILGPGATVLKYWALGATSLTKWVLRATVQNISTRVTI
jgi:hypothetical protein